MMLFERIIGLERPKIPVHQLADAVDFVRTGLITLADIESEFGIDPGDADWVNLQNAFQNAADKQSFKDRFEALMRLAESGNFNLDDRATFEAAVTHIRDNA